MKQIGAPKLERLTSEFKQLQLMVQVTSWEISTGTSAMAENQEGYWGISERMSEHI